MLSTLADGAGHTMSEIARAVLMPASTLTKLVNAMVMRKLAYRRPDRTDRRKIVIHLSARGRATYDRLHQTLDASTDHIDTGPLYTLYRELAHWLDAEHPRRIRPSSPHST